MKVLSTNKEANSEVFAKAVKKMYDTDKLKFLIIIQFYNTTAYTILTLPEYNLALELGEPFSLNGVNFLIREYTIIEKGDDGKLFIKKSRARGSSRFNRHSIYAVYTTYKMSTMQGSLEGFIHYWFYQDTADMTIIYRLLTDVREEWEGRQDEPA